ncbi:MAG: hypothetical protein JWO30_4642 [Fibrobacteres bacterium]|nr:hypothetical protein [Fibrobacterota bacterium]
MASTENPKTFESDIGTYWFDEHGILISKSKKTKRNLQNIKQNIALIKQIAAGKLPCLIVHLCYSPKPDKETLDYVAKELPNVYTAMAMVSKSGVAKLIMSILFKFKPPSIPMKVFRNEEDARKWIRQYL